MIRAVLVAVAGVAVIVGAGAYAWHRDASAQPQAKIGLQGDKLVDVNNAEQRAKLTKGQYCILYEKGTEAALLKRHIGWM